MMNRKITALTLASLLSSCPLFALAAEATQQGSALPPAAIPGINQGQPAKPKAESASKKGEEAAGSNSGTDEQTMKKESSSSDSSRDSGDKHGTSNSGS